MNKVFLTQESIGRSFLPARHYGELVPLLPQNAQIVLSASPIIRKLKRGLKDFGDNDYLLLSGDPAIIGVAVAVALENNRGKAKLLKWDKREKDYYSVDINLYEKEEP